MTQSNEQRRQPEYHVARTSLLVNLAGIACQDVQAGKAQSVSLARLQVLLANVVWDWDHLLRDSSRFTFERPGDLVWIPDRGGAAGHIVPSSDYPAARVHDLFVPLKTLQSSGVFMVFDGTETRTKGRVGFVRAVDERVVSRYNVTAHEERHWTTLARIYGGLADRELKALASSRTSHAAFLCAFVELLAWRRALDGFLRDVIRNTRGCPPFESALNDSALAEARLAIDEFNARLHESDRMKRAAEAVASRAETTELRGGLIPCRPRGKKDDLFDFRLRTLTEKRELVMAVHELCIEVASLVTGDSSHEGVERAASIVERNRQYLGASRTSLSWTKLFGSAQPFAVAKECGRLLQATADALSQELQLVEITEPAAFYSRFLERLHPMAPLRAVARDSGLHAHLQIQPKRAPGREQLRVVKQ